MYNEELKWIENGLDRLHETGKMGSLHWRATYTEEDQKARKLLEQWMREKDLEVFYDDVGNLFGKIEGEQDKIVLTGSHRDTVKNGGKYDGALGIICAIAAAGSLYAELGKPKKSVEVVAFCEEEGSRFLSGYLGSRYLVGQLSENAMQERDANGITVSEALQHAGFSGKGMQKSPQMQDIERFIELHIEQGGVLEQSGEQVGLVTSIVGLLIGKITIEGHQNHAGTTPMHLRKDPVTKAAQFITEMNQWAMAYGEAVTCTFGEIQVFPNKSNVIPGSVSLSFDIRSTSPAILQEAQTRIKSLQQQEDGFRYTLEFAAPDAPAQMDEDGLKLLEEAAKKLHLSYRKMHSGAGHDSQILAQKTKTNMIFIPSVGGISHSPEEYSKLEDIGHGYLLLKAFLREIAWT